MAIKTFNEYSKSVSDNYKSYLNEVLLAIPENLNHTYFDFISSVFEFNKLDKSKPVIICKDFSFEYNMINESDIFTYGINPIPELDKISSDLLENEYIPKQIGNIKDVKKLKFPIIAKNKESEDRYMTIGKFKKSDILYETFREDITPKTRFNIIAFKDSPICLEEVINKCPLDSNLERFKYINEVNNITKLINSNYDLDFYKVKIVESNKGKIYLNKVESISNINPLQAIKIYECAYNDFYQTRLPNWVKTKILKEHVNPYLEKKKYDAMLFKSKHAIDYSKYLDLNDNHKSKG